MEDRDKGRLIANLKSLPHELEHLVENLSDEEIGWRPIPNKWSIGEIVVHLRDVEREVFQTRIRRTVTEENPVFEYFDQNHVAEERNYREQDAREALAEFRELRQKTTDFLGSVPSHMWDRVGVHPHRGPSTLEEQITYQIKNHDMTHLVQIKDIIRIKMPW